MFGVLLFVLVLFFFFRRNEIKCKSLFKLISVFIENSHINNIFIFRLKFLCLCTGVGGWVGEQKLHILISPKKKTVTLSFCRLQLKVSNGSFCLRDMNYSSSETRIAVSLGS